MDVVETSTSASGKGRGVGNRLKQAREAKGVSLDVVSSELYILKRHLEAIERDDYDSLPQAAFTRGFVLSYAKYLKLDVDSIVSEFEAAYPNAKEIKQAPLSDSVKVKNIGKVSRSETGQKTNFGRFGALLALLGLAALAFMYFQSPNMGSTESNYTQTGTTALESIQQEEGIITEPNKNTDATANTPSTVNATSESAVQQNSASVTQADSAATEAVTVVTAEKPVVVDPNAAPAELVFWVRKNTDITITDQNGDVIMSGTKSRGEHKATGKPPFQVTVSTAKNVDLNLDNVPQRKVLRDGTQADGSARFTLTK